MTQATSRRNHDVLLFVYEAFDGPISLDTKKRVFHALR